MGNKKRIGILTSGGDCPGLNCVIRAVVSHATLTYNWEVLGIPYATQGLLERKAIALNMHGLDLRDIDMRVSVLGHIQRGGIPSALDRLTATVFGKAAVDLIAQEKYGQMLASAKWKSCNCSHTRGCG